MTATLIDGTTVAEALRSRIKDAATALLAKHHAVPGLAVVLVGENAASEVYVRSKVKQTVAVGLRSTEHKLPAETTEEALLELVAKLNADPDVDGILVQLPVPKHIDPNKVIAAIDPAKDVDGFHPVNAGKLATGTGGLIPCTPLGSLKLLKTVRDNLSGLEAVVVGRSNIVGKPMAALLLSENCTVTIAHSRTQNLPDVCRRADILIAAVGIPEFVKGDWIKPGAIVIDVGINRIDTPERGEGKTRLVGDVAFNEAVEVASAITPVPGGVGPMTIACLLANTVTAACARRGWDCPEL